VPGSVFGGQSLGSEEPRVVLYDEDKVGLFDLGEKELIERGRVAIDAPRASIMPNPDQFARWQHRRRRDWVDRICSQIQQLDDDQQQEAESYHQQLVEEGLVGVSRRLKISQALKAQRYLEALTYCQQLFKEVPLDRCPASVIERYADLLRYLGWPYKASTILSRLNEEKQGSGFAAQSSVDEETSVIQVPPEDLVNWCDAADVLEECLYGRFVLHWRISAACETTLNARRVAEKYNDQRAQHHQLASHARMRCEPIVWIEHGTSQRVDSLVIGLPRDEDLPAGMTIELVHRVKDSNAAGTTFDRALVVSVPRPADDATNHNALIRQWVEQLKDPEGLVPTYVDEAIDQAIAGAANEVNRPQLSWRL
jgi:hypothetical protein